MLCGTYEYNRGLCRRLFFRLRKAEKAKKEKCFLAFSSPFPIMSAPLAFDLLLIASRRLASRRRGAGKRVSLGRAREGAARGKGRAFLRPAKKKGAKQPLRTKPLAQQRLCTGAWAEPTHPKNAQAAAGN